MAFTQVIKTLGSVMASMKTAVDTWLSQNITNPSNPPLDRSLSLSNACAPADMVGALQNELGYMEFLSGSNNNSRYLYLDKTGSFSAGEILYVEPLTSDNGTLTFIYVYGFIGDNSTKEYQWTNPVLPEKGVYITLTNTYDKIRIAFRYEVAVSSSASAVIGIATNKNIAGRVLEIESVIPDYSNLKINCLGDSLTYGYIPKLDDDHPATQMSPTWCEQLAADFECTVRNYGITNNAVSNNPGGTGEPMCIRYATMNDDADVVIVMGGTNDFLRVNAPLGTIDSTDNTTFYGAYNVLVQGLIGKYLTRKTRIILMVPPMRNRSTEQNTQGVTLLQIQQAVRDIAHKYALPYVDWAYDAGISAYLISTDSNHVYTYDGIHIQQDIILNWILPMIEQKLKETIN